MQKIIRFEYDRLDQKTNENFIEQALVMFDKDTHLNINCFYNEDNTTVQFMGIKGTFDIKVNSVEKDIYRLIQKLIMEDNTAYYNALENFHQDRQVSVTHVEIHYKEIKRQTMLLDYTESLIRRISTYDDKIIFDGKFHIRFKDRENALLAFEKICNGIAFNDYDMSVIDLIEFGYNKETFEKWKQEYEDKKKELEDIKKKSNNVNKNK